MHPANLVLIISLVYVALLFFVAHVGDRRARSGNLGWLQSPIVYTLSISVYCSSWTYYGAVGSAARSGLEFATIYLGPTLVFIGWWVVLRKLVRIGHEHGVTSIADMISSRYGKSVPLAALVTLITVVVSMPYIALQLKAVTTSFQVIGHAGPDPLAGLPIRGPDFRLGFWITVGLAVFTILFGTRNIDAKEQHHGVVAAIALEAVVKLVSLLVVGVLVVWGISDGPGAIFAHAPPEMLNGEDAFGARWIATLFLASAAIICLPREFQVMVVENADERHLRTASWLFPLYLFLICLFILPIAIAGLAFLPAGSNPDMFVLTLPMWAGQDTIAMLAFLGGFSSATSMVIVACIAISTMVSNHIIMPVALHLNWVRVGVSGEVRRFLLRSRRVSICMLLLLGFLYFRLSGTPGALAAIGLIAFAGVAQFLPCLLGGIFWRNANVTGALAGLAAGGAIWAYTLFLPSFEFLVTPDIVRDGLLGLAWLKPHALFGLEGLDPLVHSVFWSISVNTLLFVALSLAREQRPLERLQATLFVDVFSTPADAASGLIRRTAPVRELSVLAQRILGADEAREFFEQAAREQGLDGGLPVADDAFITQLERKLAGSVGGASARAMVSQVVTVETISVDKLLRLADETERARAHSQQLEAAAQQLRDVNARLTRLDSEKDDFLSQVSHEVRTPMTSIRSFAEILKKTPDIDPARSARYIGIIHEESVRLTRLLDSTLDLNLLERGELPIECTALDPERALQASIGACQGLAEKAGVAIETGPGVDGVTVSANADRLSQVFINLIANAVKYNTHDERRVRISSRVHEGNYEVLVEDNGPGIPPDERERIFSKFMRGSTHTQTDEKGAGLGLAISAQIMQRLGGELTLEPAQEVGATFRVSLPVVAV
ncbi:sodium:solute symporter family transporter [Usitatibacter palustris]|uniref:histidine kinase n=1 Tax=Usitatibacter palustris TaxID=2732487 RepID=A0A6M4H5D1_9PROT|nr:ATP-binding protein [Usitatibacter palustris]QJR14365.1 Adaptive-response sensory-kinase SasA [Usitatibacter palustris]